MKTEKEIEDKICELSNKIRKASEIGDSMTVNTLLQQQLGLKWCLK